MLKRVFSFATIALLILTTGTSPAAKADVAPVLDGAGSCEIVALTIKYNANGTYTIYQTTRCYVLNACVISKCEQTYGKDGSPGVQKCDDIECPTLF